MTATLPAEKTTSSPSTPAVKRLPGGSWPVMLTLFQDDGSIDFPALERLTEWYLLHGSSGLFATCQSSEIFDLSFQERLALIRLVLAQVRGRVPVVAGGVITYSTQEAIEQIKQIADLGIDAVILLTNQLLQRNDPEHLLYERLDPLLEACPSVSFGLYECPSPYKRLLSPDAVGWCASTGRFVFMKETACDVAALSPKVAAAHGTPLSIYAADNPTLLDSLKAGAHGYNGILANIWPALLAEITACWQSDPSRATRIQNFIGPASFLILQNYPASAKYLIRHEIGCTTHCRVGFPPIEPAQLSALHQVWELAGSIG